MLFFRFFNSDMDRLPNTFMQKVCHSIHPDWGFGSICFEWFDQATSHCLQYLNNPRGLTRGASGILGLLHSWFGHSYTLRMEQPIPVNPKHLDAESCSYLLRGISTDFMAHAPRYLGHSIIAFSMLDIFILLAMFVLLMGSAFFLGTKYRTLHSTLRTQLPDENLLMSCFNVKDCMTARVRRSMRIMKWEVRKLLVSRDLTLEDIYPVGNIRTLIVFVSSKMRFIRGMISGQVNTEGTLLRANPDAETSGDGGGDNENKDRKVNEMVRFLNRHSRKMRAIIVFEDEQEFDEILLKPEKPSPKTSPRQRPTSPPVWGKVVPKVTFEDRKRFLEQFSPKLRRISNDSSPENKSPPQNLASAQRTEKSYSGRDLQKSPTTPSPQSARASKRGRRK